MRVLVILVGIFLIIGLVVGAGLALLLLTPSTTTFKETIMSTQMVEKMISTTLTVTKTIPYTTTATEISTITRYEPFTVTSTSTTTHYEIMTTEIHEVSAICFSRTDECDDLLISLINSAQKYIHIMIYVFTLDRLAEALINAHERGVEVKVIVESEKAYIRGSEVERLVDYGVSVALDGNPNFMHHKVMIVDGEVVVTGSYNWSYSAEEKNDENVVVIASERVAEMYELEFQRVWNQAIKL